MGLRASGSGCRTTALLKRHCVTSQTSNCFWVRGIQGGGEPEWWDYESVSRDILRLGSPAGTLFPFVGSSFPYKSNKPQKGCPYCNLGTGLPRNSYSKTTVNVPTSLSENLKAHPKTRMNTRILLLGLRAPRRDILEDHVCRILVFMRFVGPLAGISWLIIWKPLRLFLVGVV